jgi:hypothetical protein
MLIPTMKRYIIYWPETILFLLFCYFSLRELGTFPSVWEDDGLFMILARALSEGHGYGLPILSHHLPYPFFLGVGPPLILPVAASFSLFGVSAEAARIPMVAYLFAASIFTYVLAYRTSSRWNARWATALLITLSAFINTGKPVLGEIPAITFMLLAFILWMRPSRASHIAAGLALGVAVMAKMTFVFALFAACVALIALVAQKKLSHAKKVSLIACIAALPVALWYGWLVIASGGVGEFVADMAGGCDLIESLTSHLHTLLRMPYLFFAGIFVCGMAGIWKQHRVLGESLSITIALTILLFVFYFLMGPGWYRHLLPAHLLLLPFVPVGMSMIIGQLKIPERTRMHAAAACMLFICIAQGYWQWDHRGSARNAAEIDGARQAIIKDYEQTPLIIRNSELFFALPSRANWMYLPESCNASYAPAPYTQLSDAEQCMMQVRIKTAEDTTLPESLLRPLAGRYMLVMPDGCMEVRQ